MKTKVLINRKKLLAMIPLSERTIYNLEQRGEFPRRIALTSRSVAWDLAEVEEWIDKRKFHTMRLMSSGLAL
ncbi:helix-turn-helix transcriptional regulator [Chromobacterium violaceum]|uniref:helix-turn-helix transcriptional regulator n=1 Tax=Chromobacterium violaceum TaxID=536 RepID=UPI003CC8A983